jgi:N-glycosylase/DNA lyase
LDLSNSLYITIPKPNLMGQTIRKIVSTLPNPEKELMNGVKWGRCDQFFTPAYWKLQYHLNEDCFCNAYYRIGENLLEEICACILGGYGMKSEIGIMAFERLRDRGVLIPGSSSNEIEGLLASPMRLGDGRMVRYRFPRQKSKYIADLLNKPDVDDIPVDNDISLRGWLLSVKGIGMKTASWITRNWLDSDQVAILDVHIHRAGLIAGFFESNYCIIKDYALMERKFLDFSRALQVNSANLDSLMWLQLKEANSIAINILNSLSCQEITTHPLPNPNLINH